MAGAWGGVGAATNSVGGKKEERAQAHPGEAVDEHRRGRESPTVEIDGDDRSGRVVEEVAMTSLSGVPARFEARR